ncbi:hypothetical protein KNE206_30050 [Kitasatospora sp. NE20-6]|uniref:DUF3560 domain-containing protein n=1 Tax=Kitasatospora sp. NE20-6 TaxID=2859066 RepID=UPI0034DC9833
MTDATAAARAERARRRAEELTAKADSMSARADGMYDRFAGGQPLLIGHHSYRSAVRDRNRADNATRRAIEAQREAEHAQAKANQAEAVADLVAIEAARSRPWQQSDFLPGDIVTVRDFRRDMAVTSSYRVKRVNAKTLTLHAPARGFDDPKRTYDRALSRTRDGVNITNPADG